MANPEYNPAPIQTGHNGNIFTYDSAGFTCFRYQWDPQPSYDVHLPIEYFKAQLAFRGYVTQGNDLEAMKAALRGAENTMNWQVVNLSHHMRDQWEAARDNQRAAERLMTMRGMPNIELAKADPFQFLRTWFFHQNGIPDYTAPVVILPEQHRLGRMHWDRAGSQLSPDLTCFPVHDQGEMVEIVGWFPAVEAVSDEIDARQWHRNEDMGAMFQERSAFQERHPELRGRMVGAGGMVDM